VSVEREKFIERADELENAVLRDFYVYWSTRRTDGRLPGRQHIDPVDFKHILPSVALLDVVRENGLVRFRCRLMGGHHIDLMGRNTAGQFLDEVLAGSLDNVIERARQVVARKQPHYWRRRFINGAKQPREYERLFCPLAADGSNVDMLITILCPLHPSHDLHGDRQPRSTTRGASGAAITRPPTRRG